MQNINWYYISNHNTQIYTRSRKKFKRNAKQSNLIIFTNLNIVVIERSDYFIFHFDYDKNYVFYVETLRRSYELFTGTKFVN